MSPSFKARAYGILSIEDPNDPVTSLVNFFLIVLIVLNIIVFITFEGITAAYPLAFAIRFILLLTSAGVMYYPEHDARPQKFSTIFDAMWWA